MEGLWKLLFSFYIALIFYNAMYYFVIRKKKFVFKKHVILLFTL